jgi:hypothetical protein
MSHLSALALDEVAAGLALQDDDRLHLETCAECRAKRDALVSSNRALLSSRPAALTFEALTPKRSPWRLALAVAVPLAAALALFLLPQPTSTDSRLKGGFTLELLDRTGKPVHTAHPGAGLDLAVGGAGAPRVAVFAIDAHRIVTPLFVGDLHGKALEKVAHLDVTPGDVTVLAVFSSPTASAKDVEASLAAGTTLPDSVKLELEVK